MAAAPIRPKVTVVVPCTAPAIDGVPPDEAPNIDSVEVAQANILERSGTRTSDVAVDTIEPLPHVPDAFRPTYEVLCRAGLTPEEAAGIAFVGLDTDEAQGLLTRLLEAPTSLSQFGPKAVAIAILTQAASGDGLLGREVRQAVEAFGTTVIARPDGIIAGATTGEPLERAGELHQDGEVWKAGHLELGAFYASRGGALYPLSNDLEADRRQPPVFERALDRMAYGRALDGAEKAGVGLIMSFGRMVEDPIRTAGELVTALGELGQVIAASPELLERFLNLPKGDQVEAASELLVTMLLAKSAAKAGAGLMGAGGSASGLTIELNASIGRFALTLDLGAAAAGTAGVALMPVAALGPERLLSRANEPRSGPASSLPELSEKAKASVKRVAKELGKEVTAAKAKEIQRLDADRLKLIDRIDELRDRPGLSQPLRSQLRAARNALHKSVKPEEMIGAVRDRLNMPVRSPGAGRTYDHDLELLEAMESLVNLREAIAKELWSADRGAGSFADLSVLADEVVELRRRVTVVVEVNP